MITKKTIKIPIYKYSVIIIIADSFEEARSIYPELNANASGAVLESASNSIIIGTPDDTASLVHECVHLKNCIWNYIGQKVDINNDEVDAYLVEYLFEQVSKIIIKHKTMACKGGKKKGKGKGK